MHVGIPVVVVQIQDKDIPILSHLVDIRTVNLRDEEDVSTSKNDDEDDEEEDDDDEGPKVTCCHMQMPCLPYTVTWLEWYNLCGNNLMD